MIEVNLITPFNLELIAIPRCWSWQNVLPSFGREESQRTDVRNLGSLCFSVFLVVTTQQWSPPSVVLLTLLVDISMSKLQLKRPYWINNLTLIPAFVLFQDELFAWDSAQSIESGPSYSTKLLQEKVIINWFYLINVTKTSCTGIISRLCGLTKSRRKCIILCLARIAVFDEETTSRHAFLFSDIQNLLPERSPNP